MSSLRKLQAYVLGHTTDMATITTDLQAASVPVSTSVGDCRSCPDPCDQGHEEYPSRLGIDFETQMLGSVKPYRRQVVISTGKADWAREVTEDAGSLAAYVSAASGKSKSKSDGNNKAADPPQPVPGVFDATQATRLSILNGSHHTVCEDVMRETVLVFPDYKAVTDVPRSAEGAEQLWKSALDPQLGRAGALLEGSPLRTWVLPYSCVVLLCSHKRRDNRCGVAGPMLEHGFILALEREGWDVHQQLDLSSSSSGPLEDLKCTPEEKDAEVLRQLRSLDPTTTPHKRALVLKNSHVGGHKYAGNVVIYTPQGVSVWYGRVTPHQVDCIVKETIIGGRVVPPLLRGGVGLSKPGHDSLHVW